MRALLTNIFLLITLISFSQNSNDTIINGVAYNYYEKYNDGQLNVAGNYDKKNRLNGEWISFDKNGNETESGKYKNDKKVGQWMYNKNKIIWYNRKGKVKKVGKGCKDCPDF
jgi:hypothetical protein